MHVQKALPRMVANPLHRAAFTLGAHRLDQLPADAGGEVAFAGRSNAGKSSAVNALAGQRALARTSRTPGRTQQLNVFELDPGRRLVDLPGYGYAKAPADLRAHWARTLPRYLDSRGSLRGVVLVVDIRLELQPGDRVFVEACARRALALLVLATKADKLSNNAVTRAVAGLSRALGDYPGPCTVKAFSALRGTGVEAARGIIAHWLGLGVDEPGAPADRPRAAPPRGPRSSRRAAGGGTGTRTGPRKKEGPGES